MLFSLIKKNMYQDSVNLMLLSKSLSELDNVNNVSIMMGTESNKEIMKNSGLYTAELDNATNNDLCCVIDSDENVVDIIEEKIMNFFKNINTGSTKDKVDKIHTFKSIRRKMPKANIAVFSIPGKYVFKEAKKALDRDMNILIFSDNISLEEEKQLKEYALSKDLIVMGADCGTSIINGVPFAFANNLIRGTVGIIGASGTGIQEISTSLSNMGIGISNAIGLGGRDLKEEIGGVSAKYAIDLLEADANTDIIVFISKPPAKSVMEEIIQKFKNISKPVVACFIGYDSLDNSGVFFEKTLTRTVKTVSKVYKVIKNNKIDKIKNNNILGLYCGGTLANEASVIIQEKTGILESKTHEKGLMTDSDNIKIIDLGDDYYTQGKPHPMIEPSIRNEALDKILLNNDYKIVLLDNVIGYGANDNMAIRTKEMVEKYNDIIFISSVTGTDLDIQNRTKEIEILESAGVIVCENNEEAVETALIIQNIFNKSKSISQIKVNNDILTDNLNVVNIGIDKFIRAFKDNKANVIQFNWKPVANGNEELEKILEDLE